MVTTIYRQSQALLLIRYDVLYPTNQNEDFEEALRQQTKLDVECHQHPKGLVILLLSAPDYPTPNARWRRRFAEAAESFQAKKAFFALVTSSALMRGVITLVNWIKPGTRSENLAFAELSEAIGWLEQKRAEKLPALYEMCEEARVITTRTKLAK